LNNTWLDKMDNEQEEFYTSNVKKIIVERQRSTKIFIDLLRHKFGNVTNLKILDLCCGSGDLTKMLHHCYPENEFFLMDGSTDMIERARSLLIGECFHFIESTFTEFVSDHDNLRLYDIIFSSNAIHHLNYSENRDLYSAVYDHLVWGGMFINIDFVLPETEVTESWQFKMWTDWINENLNRLGLNDELNQYNDIPEKYKGKTENRPSRLFDQLILLNQIGFHHVDCFYKYGVNALFGAVK